MGSSPVRARGALVSSSAYASVGVGRWDSGYAENFSEGDLGVGVSARGVGGYGKFVPLPPPPLPIVGMPGMGGWGRTVRFARPARSGSSTYVWARGVKYDELRLCCVWMCTGAIQVCM